MFASSTRTPRSRTVSSVSRDGVGGPSSISFANRPTSPAFTDTTNASQMNFGVEGPEKIITRADLKSSAQAYEDLLAASAGYREALLHISRATSNFAEALQTCATLKGASDLSGARFQAASGLHHLMGNHWHLLSDSIDKKFERPLRQHMETYRAAVAERSQAYERMLREKSRIIRQTEQQNMNVSRKKHRNLQTFREALAVLQRQVEELDELRYDHYESVLQHEEGIWEHVQGKVSIVTRTTMDVVDRIATKASDPILEPMLQSVPDPFDAYGPPKPENQIFSILSPLAIYHGSNADLQDLTSAIPNINMHTHSVESTSGEPLSTQNGFHTSQGRSNDAQIPWPESKTPTPSPPPSIHGLASSSSSVATLKSPATSPHRRSSFPSGFASSSGSGVSVSSTSASGAGSGVQPQQRMRSEVKLRNVLSAISEKSGHSQASTQYTDEREENSRFSSPHFQSGHERDASHDTLRARKLPREVSEILNGEAAEHDEWPSGGKINKEAISRMSNSSESSLPEGIHAT